jgi:hypothetical protein
VAVRVHWVAHRGVCWIFLWLVAACLWEKIGEGPMIESYGLDV